MRERLDQAVARVLERTERSGIGEERGMRREKVSREREAQEEAVSSSHGARNREQETEERTTAEEGFRF